MCSVSISATRPVIKHLCGPTQLPVAQDLGCWRQYLWRVCIGPPTPLHPTPRERMRETLARRTVERGPKRPHVDLRAVRCHRSALAQSTAASPRPLAGRSTSFPTDSRWDENMFGDNASQICKNVGSGVAWGPTAASRPHLSNIGSRAEIPKSTILTFMGD